ncbi:hypothetical protein GGH96_004774 [Coemansia sp. RSA 1972]|nr:hypothetical protein GGH96_004774 [Coemansia sp. RSA 1972]
MKLFATLSLAATAAVAQQVGSSSGPSVSDGEAAVSHPNINNGLQLQNSLADSSNKGGNVFHNLEGNTFTDALSNTGLSDNNFVNPSSDNVSGNSGATTNGHGNQIGDIAHGLAGFAPPVGTLIHKRDVVFNNVDHSAVWGHPVQGVPVFAPVVGFPVRPHPGFAGPGAHVNHNVQNAAIVQKQV